MSTSLFSANDTIFGNSYQHWIEMYWNRFGYSDFFRGMGKVYCLPGRIPELQKTQLQTDFKIKQDKAILLSPMNFIRFTPDIERVQSNEYVRAELKRMVKERMDVIQELQVNLDGKNIGDQLVRVATDFFILDKKMIAISDGFWLFLKPKSLEKGEHKIDTFSSCSSGQTQLPMFYKLDIN